MPLIPYTHWRAHTAIALALSLLFGLVLSSLTFASGPGLVPISSDPYTNISSQHKTEVEPDNYSNGSTIVNTFQAGRFMDGGSSNIGWATSTDNGKSWKDGFLPGTTVYATPRGKYARISDPAVAYDAALKTWLIVSLAILIRGQPVGTSVLASRSTDAPSNGCVGSPQCPVGAAVLVSRSADGLTWSNPVTVANNGGNGDYDKSWIGCDSTASSKFYGHCYVEYDDIINNLTVLMSTSIDGGKTWGSSISSADHASGSGGQPLVQPDGTVVVVFAGRGINAFTSTDGGKSWGKSVLVATETSHAENGSLRAPAFPSVGVDSSGKVYTAWADCRFEKGCAANDIVMSTSINGTSWSKVQRIPIDKVGSGVDHFLPGLGVDRTKSGKGTHLGLMFYFYPVSNCGISTCQLDVGFISSTNGGSTWSKEIQLAGPMRISWLPDNGGFMIGDYMSTTITNGKAFPIFGVAFAPQNSVFNLAMYTVSGGLSVTGGYASSTGGQAYVVANHPARVAISSSDTLRPAR